MNCFKPFIKHNGRAVILLLVLFPLVSCGCGPDIIVDPPPNGGEKKKGEKKKKETPFEKAIRLRREGDRLLHQKNTPDTCKQALENYQEAKSLVPDFRGLYWRMARACHFICTHYKKGDSEREKWAKEGLEYSKKALKDTSPSDAQSNYYLALFTGIIADEAMAPDPDVVLEIVKHALNAHQLDPSHDYGGPSRLLGDVYLQSPPFPRSIGDKEKAVEYLRLAVDENPDYQENQLLLGEAYFFWAQELFEDEDEQEEAKKAMEMAKKALDKSLKVKVFDDRKHLKAGFDAKAKALLESIKDSFGRE